MKPFEQSITSILQKGGIGIIPTDTIYGVVGRAELKETVERIYAIRNRDHTKACIVLISSYEDLEKFTVELLPSDRDFIERHTLWPGKVSIILPITDSRFTYLTRGTNSLAFRMPNVPELQELIRETGPLIAPSANKEGSPHARTIRMAEVEFRDLVDFYVDGGEMNEEASTIIRLIDGTFTLVREGAVHISSRS